MSTEERIAAVSRLIELLNRGGHEMSTELRTEVRIAAVSRLWELLMRGVAVDEAMRVAILVELEVALAALDKTLPKPRHRSKSFMNEMAVSVMHELVEYHGAKQDEAAHATSGDEARIGALKQAYKLAKKAGKLRNTRIMGAWVDSAVRNLHAIRKSTKVMRFVP